MDAPNLTFQMLKTTALLLISNQFCQLTKIQKRPYHQTISELYPCNPPQSLISIMEFLVGFNL